MVFSSEVFLFLFLPVVLLVHCLLGRRAWNTVLLVASLIFYTWGEQAYVLIMVYSITISYIIGRLLEITKRQKTRNFILGSGIALNLIPLVYFKYSGFLIENLNSLFNLEVMANESISLPIGISFFTFQAISYLIDLFRGEAQPQRSIWQLGLYISLFPQLIAGPIVRYHDINKQISQRTISLSDVGQGAERFIIGLAKKVLIANPIGELVDSVFSLDPTDINAGLAWLAILGYSLQIYFDFSGYSDMAIGLCRMFGFRLKENFYYPYYARSIKDFWRRWHISLSSWFRDYLYIPLGGNRLGATRTMTNLFIVFLLCGLWHGASWNFIAWGLFHGFLLSVERIKFIDAFMARLPGFMAHTYTLLMVGFGWVLFRSPTLDYALDYFISMFSFNRERFMDVYLLNTLNNETYIAMAVGILFSMPIYPYLKENVILPLLDGTSNKHRVSTALIFRGLLLAVFSSLFLLSIISTVSGDYNPFLYFRF